MPNVIEVLVVISFLLCVLNAIGYVPLWISVLLLTIVEMLRVFPLGK